MLHGTNKHEGGPKAQMSSCAKDHRTKRLDRGGRCLGPAGAWHLEQAEGTLEVSLHVVVRKVK